MPSEREWIALAAFIDGEGAIMIKKVEMKPPSSPNRATQYLLVIEVSNTDLRLPHWCKAVFGGHVSPERPHKSGHKPHFHWIVTAQAAEVVLKGCLPYFLLKKDRAELGLAFRATFKAKRRRGKAVPEEMTETRENFRQSLHVLNKRGAAA